MVKHNSKSYKDFCYNVTVKYDCGIDQSYKVKIVRFCLFFFSLTLIESKRKVKFKAYKRGISLLGYMYQSKTLLVSFVSRKIHLLTLFYKIERSEH